MAKRSRDDYLTPDEARADARRELLARASGARPSAGGKASKTSSRTSSATASSKSSSKSAASSRRKSGRGAGATGGRTGGSGAANGRAAKRSGARNGAAGAKRGGNGRRGSSGVGKTHPAPGRRFLAAAAFVCAAACVLAVAARALPAELQSLPYVPVLVAATPWFMGLSVVALMLAIASRRLLAGLLAVVTFAANVWWQYPFFSTTEPLTRAADAAVGQAHAVTGDAYARVMTCNVYKGRADARAIVETVRDERVEVLALQETTDAFVDRLEEAGIGDYLPYAKVSSSDGMYGNGLWSASPLISPADDDVNSSASFMPGGTIAFADGVRIRFVSVHTTAPVPGYWRQWRRALDELGAMRAHTDTRYVFMGDFNATYDHAPFREFLGDRFRDGARLSGRGWTFTWPADRGVLPPRFAGIDHVVVDQGVTAGRMKVVVVPGTDHAALLATLAVR